MLLKVIIIGLILLVVFGGKRFGEIGKGLGEGIRNFKKAMGDGPSPKPEDSDTKIAVPRPRLREPKTDHKDESP